MADKLVCDLLVVGSGAAGLTAALTAAHGRLDVTVLEKAPVFGGTTALSEGMVWVPGSRQAKAAGVEDCPEAVLAYIEAAAGIWFDSARAAAYVSAAPEMLAFVEDVAGLRYSLARGSVDYYQDLPGATKGARSLIPGVVDGRQLGPDFAALRWPLRSHLLLGVITISALELERFLNARRSPADALYVLGVVARYGLDLLRGRRRGTRIANGAGVIAGLWKALKDRNVRMRRETAIQDLIVQGGAVLGAIAGGKSGHVEIRARHGVVLACGGFPASEDLRRRFYPHVAGGRRHIRIAPESNTGDGVRLAEVVGAQTVSLPTPAVWAPASVVPLGRGEQEGFPHFSDRQKPGFIVVDRHGRRFVNEALTYSDFVEAMIKHCADDPEVEAFLIGDHPSVRRYGIGAVPPSPLPIGPYIRSGYLTRARSAETLARALGVDEDEFVGTLKAFNENARLGIDPDFNRGVSVYDRTNGDPEHGPNPCLAPIEQPPFYAVRLGAGDIGTLSGLKVDRAGRVLDSSDEPIPGLYAAGNDAGSLFGGKYPAGGASLGPAMTFGYAVARHVLEGVQGNRR